MKILLSVFQCNPLQGSDAFVGWSYVKSMAKYHEVYAFTRTQDKKDIETYCKNTNQSLDNVHFIYIDQSKFFTKVLYKLNRYLGYLGSYFVWQHSAYKVAKRLRKEIKFDICHHVSIADFRCAGYLWKLDAPFIFGPVGGGQETPQCFSDYIKGHEKAENFRIFMNRITTALPSYKKALHRAAVVYSSNDETSACIKKRMLKSDLGKLKQMTELCIDQSYLDAREDIKRTPKKTVHIIVSGRLIYRKGIRVLLESIPMIKSKNKFIVDIYGDGNQRESLEKYVKDNNLHDVVAFHGKIPFDEMQKVYRDADIYVLPSLRETTGTAIFEAMANKLPVVTFNQNGAKYVVENDAGVLIDLESKTQVIEDLAKALGELIDDPERRVRYGKCGFNKLKSHYTWDERAKKMSKVYDDLLKENNKP